MNKGFFSTSNLTQEHTAIPRTPQCGLCGLYKHCQSPKMQYTGKGRKKILVVAEAPGGREDEEGTQLIGKAGQRLRKSLRHLDIDLDKDCWKDNAVICRPVDNVTPTDDQINACRPNLFNTIKKLQPNLIILLGAPAVKSVLEILRSEKITSISKWVGLVIPSQRINSWIASTYHPSYILRMQSNLYDVIFERHLKTALKKAEARPWKEIPDYEKQVEIIYEPIRAANVIREMIKRGGRVAFDFETNCLKPEIKGARLFSCSVCWNGKRTIAYPWEGEVIEATKEMLLSPLGKIASNLKFEDRWSRTILNTKVKNWIWDTMIAAHVIDNREEITGIKFQAFLLLGAEDWSGAVEPYLKSKPGGQLNRINELDLHDLLLYNGLDSLFEYQVAMKQMKILEGRN